MDQSCLFCKIALGEIPSVKIYEDEKVLAFLDISPIEKGHTLVISKHVHSEALLETSDEVLGEMLAVVKKIGAAMMKAGFGGYNVVQNNYPDGGQMVPHIHFHVIPRVKGREGVLTWESGGRPYRDDAERDEYAAKLRAGLV